jgi:uncharacterized protein
MQKLLGCPCQGRPSRLDSRFCISVKSLFITLVLAGVSTHAIFVVPHQTLFEEPELFQNYIAVDPSLWWNKNGLICAAKAGAAAVKVRGRSVMVVTSGEPSMAQFNAEFAEAMENHRADGCTFVYLPLPSESHATTYHPAAFRTVLAPPPPRKRPCPSRCRQL